MYFFPELLSTESLIFFPDNTLSLLSNILPEQSSLEDNWEVARTEVKYPIRFKKDTSGYFMFFFANKKTNIHKSMINYRYILLDIV